VQNNGLESSLPNKFMLKRKINLFIGRKGRRSKENTMYVAEKC
jgi:hypothetical protein